jgi:diguanylate cyclase (GGDEF)-like protein/PAS domain S-box-containing protein
MPFPNLGSARQSPHRKFVLKGRHTGLRLGMAFAALIAILLVIGQLGLRRMQAIDDTLGDITGRQSTNLQLARRALMLSNINSRMTLQIVLVENRELVKTLLAARSENSSEITRLVEESERRCRSEDERQLLLDVKKTRKPYVESYLRAIHLLVDDRKHDEAEAVIVNETLPLLLKYHAAWDTFVDFQKNEMDEAVKQAQVDYAKERRAASLLIVLAIALAIVIAAYTTRNAAREIAARIEATNEVGKLNAGLEERVLQRTRELGEANKQLSNDVEKLRQAEARLELQAAALEAAANAIVITDSHGSIVWVNNAFTAISGFSKEEVLGKNPRLLKSGKQPQSYYADLWSTVSSGKVWHGELTNRRKDGTTYIEEMTITPIAQNVGQANWTHFIAVKQDITERKRAERELRLTQFSMEHASDNIFWSNSQGHFVYVNKAACDSLGYSREEILSLSVSDLNPRFRKGDDWSTFWEELKRRGSITFEGENTSKQGRAFPVEVTANYLEFDGQEYSFAFVRDITDRKVAEDRVRFLAYYDALTGLPNRILLQDRLQKALAGARRQKKKVALLFLDLDKFKDVNDSLGHSVGDILLQQVAERLKTWAREQDTVARLGGDEFLIMLTHVNNIHDAAVAAERLKDAMTAEFVIQGHPIRIGCSVGISIFPEHGEGADDLIKNADTAMYGAKENGRNNFRFFTEEMHAQVVERLTLENSLRLALEKKELFLVYQPQMDITTGRIIGLEALLRWQHPKLGLVPPDKFIRIAENSGLIVPIGEWVLRTACRQARKWQDEGLPAISVAVNVSAVQFRQEDFCEVIRRVLDETSLAPQYLELELTESLLLSNADVMFSVFRELKAMGLKLAIDDFGTGYSSLSYLKKFPVSKLKIDRSFVRDVAVNPDDAAIAIAIISMAKILHLKVIAEGVENEEQMSFLRAHQCDEIQGYYFSKPLAVDKVADKLRGNTPMSQVRAHSSGGQL